jgi:nucleotide-binding universal stress UspA family protein
MKKIAFVCDGGNFPNGAFEFLKMLNDAAPVSVRGIFFEPIDFQQLVSISYIPVAGPYVKLKEEERALVKKSREEFTKKCESAGISYTVDTGDQEWVADLFAKETRFADLAIVSEELFCSDFSDNQPNVFMQEALRMAECPVVLVPENFELVDRIVIAYDGKKESMFALKQFCYVLSELTGKLAEFVYVKDEESEEIPDMNLLKEYSRLHFDSLGVAKLHFDAHKYFSSWAEDKKHAMLVSGSYSRSSVSNFLKSSFASQVVHEHQMPVFIAHRN